MKAISPVIATVIIVAVAIAISIAVALWITGLTSSFTGVEKLEIVNAYATRPNAYVTITIDGEEKNYKVWNITLIIKNTGTKSATIDGIFINQKPSDIAKANFTLVGSGQNPTNGFNSFTVNPGRTVVISFVLRSNQELTNTDNLFDATDYLVMQNSFTSGQTVSIVVHTASGGQYPATVTLP